MSMHGLRNDHVGVVTLRCTWIIGSLDSYGGGALDSFVKKCLALDPCLLDVHALELDM